MLLNMQSRAGVATGGSTGYQVATPPVFDGANDYMLRGADFTGNADSKSGLLSFWTRLDGGDSAGLQLIANTGSKLLVQRNSSNLFRVRAQNAAAGTIMEFLSSNTYLAGASWIHVLAAWDLAASTVQLVINGSSDIAGAPTATNDTIDYTVADYCVGGLMGTSLAWNGAMCEVYFAPGQYLDISSAANVQKFRSSAGKPVDLGSTGSTPTGTAPILYLKNAYNTFGTNSGTGGDLTVTGTLTASATSPSD